MKTAVICPVFDEGATIRHVCDGLRGLFDLVVVVDDGSPVPVDPADLPGVRVIRHDRNLGKGRALRTGFACCLDRGAEVIGTIDGDGEHAPEAFSRALDVFDGEGLLNLSRAPFYGGYNRFRRTRNVVFSRLVSARVGTEMADTQSGMRLFSRAAVEYLMRGGIARGYAVETEALVRLADAGFRISERHLSSIGPIRPGRRYPNALSLLSDVRLLGSVALGGLFRAAAPRLDQSGGRLARAGRGAR